MDTLARSLRAAVTEAGQLYHRAAVAYYKAEESDALTTSVTGLYRTAAEHYNQILARCIYYLQGQPPNTQLSEELAQCEVLRELLAREWRVLMH